MNIDEASASFALRSAQAYPSNSKFGFTYSSENFSVPCWRAPWDHIVSTAQRLENETIDGVAAADILLHLQPDCHDFIFDFLHADDCSALSFCAHGDQALVFEIKSDCNAARRTILWISSNEELFGHKRIWCPALLQASKMANEGIVTLESMPLIAMTYDDQGLAQFLEDRVFRNTPFKIHCGKDLGLLPSGTPIFVDPGDIELRGKNKPDFSPADKQRMMATISDNCRSLPEPLQWVVKLPSGDFETRQDAIFSTPLRPRPTAPDLSNRSLVA